MTSRNEATALPGRGRGRGLQTTNAIVSVPRSDREPAVIAESLELLDLTRKTVRAFGAAVAPDGTLGWSLRDASGEIVGRELLLPTGRRVVRGEQGLAFAAPWRSGAVAWICEQPADAAAITEIGFCGVSRCDRLDPEDRELAKLVADQPVVLVAQDDPTGRVAAAALASWLRGQRVDVAGIVVLPFDDVRTWRADRRAAGVRREDLALELLDRLARTIGSPLAEEVTCGT